MSSDSGHPDPPEALGFEEAYATLRALAGAQFRAQGSDHTLQPTALVHEAYMRLAKSDSAMLADREHLLALASPCPESEPRLIGMCWRSTMRSRD